KTGTLTENTLRFAGLELVPGAAVSSGSDSGSDSGGASSCAGSSSGTAREQHDDAATSATGNLVGYYRTWRGDPSQSAASLPARPLDAYLYEPDPALMR
ncbi:hypothetical protein OJ928_10890, partial [Streptococcus anginosus]|nr:hypothetical protein [Streptococcus anginosus]